jgi:homoserine kinase
MQFGKTITVRCPGTIANLVCGFDVLGLCLQEPYDEMDVTLLPERKIIIHSADGYPLPTNPALNTAGAPLLEIMEESKQNFGFEISLHKHIKPGSGVGSSAASATGAVVAANYLLGHPFSKEEMVSYAMFGEKVACGVKHADNIAPAIYGGITLIRSIFPLDIIALPSPPLYVALVHPQIEVKTADARQILRKEVALKDAIKQWGNIAGLVAGLFQDDYDLISRSLEDVIIEPVRSILIPGFNEVKRNCIEAGALGGGISGSGPSIFMLCKHAHTANAVAEIMKEVYSRLGIEHHTYVTKVNGDGARIIKHESE